MTQDEIIRMAREAGAVLDKLNCNTAFTIQELERFAALVAAHEREACAKVCDEMEEKAEDTECCKWPTPIDCAAAIRARGETK